MHLVRDAPSNGDAWDFVAVNFLEKELVGPHKQSTCESKLCDDELPPDEWKIDRGSATTQMLYKLLI